MNGGPSTTGKRLLRGVCGALIIAGLLAAVPVQQSIDRQWRQIERTDDRLYVPSGALLRKLSLGHEGLLANIYWTRAVQYFGRQRLEGAERFDLLGPLLRIATELDPQLVIAYRFGALFLSGSPPHGAGQPEEALHLLRRGIVANPDYWRLWQDLGFIYYWDLKDYDTAARIFQTGSERPGAMVWMKVLAATVSAEGGGIQTSRILWSEIYEHADNDQIRQSALEHLAALQALEDLQGLTARVTAFREREGRAPRSWSEMIEAGLLRSVPRDPTGLPYRLTPDGRVMLAGESKVNLRLLE
jgi:tetratricopeptide (TPR) repeat protein